MPPRGAGGRGGGPRGGGPRRGGPGSSGGPSGGGDFVVADHITTVGVKRPGYGSSGKAMLIYVNAFSTTISDGTIYHYDIVITPVDLPSRMNMELIKELQTRIAPDIFTPRAVFDGRKNMFSSRKLQLGPGDTKEFEVPLQSGAKQGDKAPKPYNIRLTLVATINPEILRRFVAGQQSQDNSVQTAITALNVVIRMEPSLNNPFNVRSFFTRQEFKDIGGGLELWRGYFQSVRPGSGLMFINIDISTGTMYKSNPLMQVCLEYLNKDANDTGALSSRRLEDRDRLRLQRFIQGIRVKVQSRGPNDPNATTRVVKRLTTTGASEQTFKLREGPSITVADYFKRLNVRVAYPDNICCEVGNGALIPIEFCFVPPGQIMRKQVPADKTRAILEFATKKPSDRLRSITAGLNVLAYGQSEYVRSFGMQVDTSGPLRINARVLTPPRLKYGRQSKEATITPRNGAWNMANQKLLQPVKILGWMVVNFEQPRRFGQHDAERVVKGLTDAAVSLGIDMRPTPYIFHRNVQAPIADTLRGAGLDMKNKTGALPLFILVILPEGGNDIYTAVKHFGDVAVGVPTQCLKSTKCRGANAQYFSNVCLKMNVKLGGINTTPDPASAAVLNDPHNPTIVMGADVVHPAPGSDGRPSFAALVGNVDSDSSKYIARSSAQTSRQEIIEDLKPMCISILNNYMLYRKNREKKPEGSCPPKRIIFYRDGVSEGQFKEVLDKELKVIQSACQELRISPKITMIVVGKRHHIRFFPQNERDGDPKTGNCPAGTVVDRDVSHPTEFDFYLQSHGGLLGTSRPAHYSVLYDENNFSADALQSLSFTLCHVYARSTRSVSIPAPVYYADIVCARAKNHYEPGGGLGLELSETATQSSSQAMSSLEAFKNAYRPVHPNQASLMYFS